MVTYLNEGEKGSENLYARRFLSTSLSSNQPISKPSLLVTRQLFSPLRLGNDARGDCQHVHGTTSVLLTLSQSFHHIKVHHCTVIVSEFVFHAIQSHSCVSILRHFTLPDRENSIADFRGAYQSHVVLVALPDGASIYLYVLAGARRDARGV